MSEVKANLGDLCEVVRLEEPDASKLGVVRSVGHDYVALQSVDDACRFDGFAAFRLESVARLREPTHSDAIGRVLAYHGGAIGVPEAKLFKTLLEALSDGRLVTLHDDDPSVCWIGSVKVDSGLVFVNLVRPNGEDGGTIEVPVKDVTLVEWGTAYDEAISIMARTLATAHPG